MSINQIIATMDKLNMMHRSLLKLATNKTDILQQSDIEGLKNIMKNEQAHLAAISKLNEQREKEVLTFLQERQLPQTDITLTGLINYSTAAEAVKLNEVRQKLLNTVEELKNKNELNQQILFQSLQFVNLTLDLLRPQEDQMNYSAEAGNRSNLKRGQFDSQA